MHVALFRKLLLLSGWDLADVNIFCHCLIHGFPTMGLLDAGPYDVKVNEKKKPDYTKDDMLGRLQQTNREVVSRAKPSEFSGDVYQQTMADANKGWMSFLEVVAQHEVSGGSSTQAWARRIAVREDDARMV